MHLKIYLLLLSLWIIGPLAVAAPKSNLGARIGQVLTQTPVIDGHNDLPWQLKDRFKGRFSTFDLRANTSMISGGAVDIIALMTDIPRLRRGQVGGQFWSVWVPSELHGSLAVQATLEQIDIVRQMTDHYPEDLEMAYSATDVHRIQQSGRIASLIGIEGGHQINNSLAVLRQMHSLGARYMTLTHTSNTDWADSATDTPQHHGLSPFGREVVREMNRMGMLVDLSHASPETMRAALEITEAPVIFSHSSARALVDHPRNVPDEILRLVARNAGVVMVNFYPAYVSAARNQWEADYAAEQTRFSSPPYVGLYLDRKSVV